MEAPTIPPSFIWPVTSSPCPPPPPPPPPPPSPPSYLLGHKAEMLPDDSCWLYYVISSAKKSVYTVVLFSFNGVGHLGKGGGGGAPTAVELRHKKRSHWSADASNGYFIFVVVIIDEADFEKKKEIEIWQF